MMHEAVHAFTATVFGQVVVGVVVAVIVALVLMVGHRAYRALGDFHDFLEDWRGEPARGSFPERPGVMQRLAALESQGEAQGAAVATLHRQMGEVVDELPRNGVPVGQKINALWGKYLDDQERAAAAAEAHSPRHDSATGEGQ